uniref:Pseudouridine synthase RsuA/RluA-like domain-containing protein n=1 Tax=Chaetoceros debilis TaxID=122233 RepID=A0A6S8SN09_9STRA
MRACKSKASLILLLVQQRNTRALSFKTTKLNASTASKQSLGSKTTTRNIDLNKVFNPLTKRYIQQTGDGNKSSKWYQFMFVEGGNISHNNSLTPIQLKELRRWRKDNKKKEHRKSDNEGGNSAGVEYPAYEPDLSWQHIKPSIQSSIACDEGDDENTELPLMDQLLFVYKPSNLLTLPGIGPEKAVCVASVVNKWLSSSSNDTSTSSAKGQEGPSLVRRAKESVQWYLDASAKSNQPKKKKRKRNANKVFVPRPCHRLDLDTSGVMIIALTSDAMRITSSMFEGKRVQKSYVALVAGHINLDEEFGVVEYSIGKVYNNTKDVNEFRCFIPTINDGGKNNVEDTSRVISNASNVCAHREEPFVEGSLRTAKTEYRISKKFTIKMENGKKAKYTRVNLKPLTGRGHQLRLHMAAIGHPILGDTLHAPNTISKATPRLCLHAEKIEMEVLASSGSEGGVSMERVKLLATSVPPY